jgi:hypothetical protein
MRRLVAPAHRTAGQGQAVDPVFCHDDAEWGEQRDSNP